VWTKNGGALVVVASRTRFEKNDEPSITHSFDAGAAWENLALEATRRELVAHATQGFDYERAKTELSIPSDFDVNAMIAIGRRAPAENLPDKYRAMEPPSKRRPLHEIVFEGAFGAADSGVALIGVPVRPGDLACESVPSCSTPSLWSSCLSTPGRAGQSAPAPDRTYLVCRGGASSTNSKTSAAASDPRDLTRS